MSEVNMGDWANVAEPDHRDQRPKGRASDDRRTQPRRGAETALHYAEQGLDRRLARTRGRHAGPSR